MERETSIEAVPPVHHLARAGFAQVPEVYERARPGYPDAAVALLVRELGLRPGATVVDVGAGTGKLTRQLLGSGAQVLAVEPLEAMRAKLAAAVPGVVALEGSAEALPLAAGSADAVVAGQAFHWFDGPAALAEFHRVLRPGGGIGLIWNARDEADPVQAELSEIIEPHEADAPRHRRGDWRRAFDVTDLFSPLLEARFEHSQEADEETFVGRIASTSIVAVLTPDVREQVLGQVREVFDRHAGERGTVVLPYRTEVFWCRRLP